MGSREVVVFALEGVGIVVEEDAGEHTRLAEEESFDTEGIVLDFGEDPHGRNLGEEFEGEAISLAAKIVGDKLIAGLFPIAASGLE